MASTPGITARHSRVCASRTGARCNCDPSYEAWTFDKKALGHQKACASRQGAACDCEPTRGVKIRKSFPTLAAAKIWRSDSSRAVRLKTLRAPTGQTFEQAWDEFLAGAKAGEIRNRRKQVYKPSVLRQYESAIKKRVQPELGDRRLSDIDAADLLDLKERLLGHGISDSTVRNAFVPVQALFRRALKKGLVAVNPALNLDLPAGDRGREKAATPKEASSLLSALPVEDQALWATAFYAGLRRGELRALRACDVNETCIHVEFGWDDKQGQQAPKSQAGRRDVPLAETLRVYLTAHLERTGRTGEDLVFGRTAADPFTPTHVSDRADEVWTEQQRFTLHEARHSFSTFLDAAGISETRADRYMGHSNGSVAGRYRHQLEGQLAQDAATIDAYLTGAVAGKVVALKAAG